MLKKVMNMVASKYIAIKVRIRAIETHLMIQSLLLQDKKMIRHLFRQRKHFNLVSNKVKDEDEDEDEDEDYQSESPDTFTNGSIATTPLIHSSVATTPVGIVQVVEEDEDKMVMDDDDDDDCMESRCSVLGDEGKEVECVSVIEMVKNVKEGRGKKFVLEEDIDKVADLFIQRFHHQIRLQKRLSEEDKERNSD